VFVVEQAGVIRLIAGGTVNTTPFLDIRDRVTGGGEKGLLSVAFHPDYSSNGRFFVSYSAPLRAGGTGDHTGRVAEFTISADPDVADPASENLILEVDQPLSNHNGGQIRFGPDGLLYIALGDGGGGNDPGDNAQNTGNLLGAILRIDVDGAAPYSVPAGNPFVGGVGADEIWAYGLRNPWRFTIDGDEVYIADVGQGAREEVDVMPLATPGINYGWRTFEGTRCTGNDPTCSTAGLTPPVLEYSHAEGCSITGGEVYRGTAVTQLVGHYVYSDYCTGFIRSFRYDDGEAAEPRDWTDQLGARSLVVSFGVDGSGELYLVSTSGTIWKFVPTG
jgi:glucose/arabinose dehydrogenase